LGSQHRDGGRAGDGGGVGGSAAAQRDVIVSFALIPILTKDVLWRKKALAEALAGAGRLAPRDLPMLEVLRKQAAQD